MDRASRSRDRLERAALRCFVRHGVDGATTQAIARSARMSEGNLYRHHKSKEALAEALYLRHLDLLTRDLDLAAGTGGGARARLAALLACFRALFEKDPDAFSFLLLAQHEALPRLHRARRDPADVVAGVIAGGQKSGEIRKGSPPLLAGMVVGMVVRVCWLRLHGLLAGDLDALQGELEAACWRVVAREGKA